MSAFGLARAWSVSAWMRFGRMRSQNAPSMARSWSSRRSRRMVSAKVSVRGSGAATTGISPLQPGARGFVVQDAQHSRIMMTAGTMKMVRLRLPMSVSIARDCGVLHCLLRVGPIFRRQGFATTGMAGGVDTRRIAHPGPTLQLAFTT